MIYIIGGKKKRSLIQVPEINVRPTSAKKKESIFSILESKAIKNNIEIYNNKYFLDLYAGTGSLGLEALSRGAKFCYFYEIDKQVIHTLKQNCLKIAPDNCFKILESNATEANFQEIEHSISTIFIDPPYNLLPFKKIFENLLKSKLISNQTFIVIESHKTTNIYFPSQLKIIDERIYNKTKITFLSMKFN